MHGACLLRMYLPGRVVVSVSNSVVCSTDVVVIVVPGAVETCVTVKSIVEVLNGLLDLTYLIGREQAYLNSVKVVPGAVIIDVVVAVKLLPGSVRVK